MSHKPTPFSTPRGVRTGRRLAADSRRWADNRRTVRPEGTDDWLLILTTDGAGLVVGGEEEFAVRANTALLYKPRTPHLYSPHPDGGVWDIAWAHFLPRPHWLDWLGWEEIAPGISLLAMPNEPVFTQAVAALQKTIRLTRGGARNHLDLAINALEEVILLCDQENPLAEEARLDTRVRTALTFLCTHLTETIRVADVAAACHLSVSRLAHLFREQTGRGVQEYVEIQRLGLAQQKLEWTEEPVAQIAFAVGFSDAYYFSRRFKIYTGISPRAYRETHRI